MDHFSLEENGYNRSEVNTFLSNVIKQTNDLIEKCKVQTEEIERLKKDLIIYKDRENSINEIISKAEIECDNLRQKARDEREIIINDAKYDASLIVNEALLRAQKIEESTKLLESNIKIFKTKLRLLVEQQKDIVEEIEEIELED